MKKQMDKLNRSFLQAEGKLVCLEVRGGLLRQDDAKRGRVSGLNLILKVARTIGRWLVVISPLRIPKAPPGCA